MGQVLSGSGLVKICGLREPEHAIVAAEAGANLIGLIFAPARRRVTPEAARGCVDAARKAAGSRLILAVGVFVDATIDEMNATAETANLDLLQLHGDEPAAMLEQLSRPVVKAFRPPAGASVDQLGSVIRQYQQVANAPVAYLIDGYAAHAAGGEGVRADWQLAAALAEVFPIFLAGGLDPETVGAAIAAVRPLAVDVSSGVETDGVKDLAKIVTFVEAARQGFRL